MLKEINKIVKGDYPLIVFPTRRSVLFFEDIIKKENNTALLPKMYGLNDFVDSISFSVRLDDIEAVSYLYKSYRKYIDKTFAEVYPLLRVMLRDFTDIVMTIDEEKWEDFFDNLKNISLIEKEIVRNAVYIDKHIKTMGLLREIFYDFYSYLKENNLCYGGICVKHAYNNIRNGLCNVPYDNIYFVGFNALTDLEIQLMNSIKEIKPTNVIFESDDIIDNDDMIGYFVNKSVNRTGGIKIKGEKTLKDKKKIKIVSSPTPVSQMSVLSDILRDLKESGIDVGVILLESDHIMPLLMHIPKNIETFNITMGMPIINTPLGEVIKIIAELYKTGQAESGKFRIRNVIDFFSHPFMSSIEGNSDILNKLFEMRRNGELFVNSDLHYILQCDNGLDLVLNTNEVIKSILSFRKNKDIKIFSSVILKHFERLANVLGDHIKEMDSSSFAMFMISYLKSVTVPFEGDPLEGLQIMGLLETRTLSFKKLIFVSSVDGVMPSTIHADSLIPMDVRKHYGMYMPQDDQRIFAYHLFRAMKGADDITFLYYRYDEDGKETEKSRFIRYIEWNNDIKRGIGENWDVKSSDISYSLNVNVKKIKNIKKDDEIIDKMLSFSFSPTSLITYISCPYRFYLQYIRGINIYDKDDENMDFGEFGSLIHFIMEKIYIKDKAKIRYVYDWKDKYNDLVNEFLKKEDIKKRVDYGKNRLFVDIGRILIERIIEEEKNVRDINEVLDIYKEKKIEGLFEIADDKRIKLKGFIDRVDKTREGYIIIDYKTGGVGVFSPNRKGTFIDEEDRFISDKTYEYKAHFQVMIYKYLWENKENNNIKELYIYNLSKGKIERCRVLDNFNESLKNMFVEMFDKDVPFENKTDSKMCKYCPFASICGVG